MIVTFAGNRVDGPGRPEPRFPTQNVEAVGRRVEAFLTAEQPDLVVGAAASGADLLVLREARQLGIPLHVVLPLSIERFRAKSVEDQGQEWVDLFDRMVLTAEGLTVHDLSQHDDWYLQGNDVILSTAAWLAGARTVHGLVAAADEDDSASNDFRRKLEQRGWSCSGIDPARP